jgi:hypothetical protein
MVQITNKKKKPILGDRSLENNATAKLLLFKDSGNDLIPSNGGLCGSNMGMHGKTKKQSKWFCQKAVLPSIQECVTQSITS